MSSTDDVEEMLAGLSPAERDWVKRELQKAPPLTQKQIDAIHSLMRSDGPPRPRRRPGRASGET